MCLEVWLSYLSLIYNCGCNRILECACFFLWMKSSVQFSWSVVSDFLWPHGLQHVRLPCPSPTPGACSNSCPSSRWCQSIGVSPSASVLSMNIQDWFPLGWTHWISLQSEGFSRVFSSTTVQKHQFFSSGGQSIRASAPVLPMNIQDWFPLGWTHWISLQCKGHSRIFSNTAVQKHQFFGAQLSL